MEQRTHAYRRQAQRRRRYARVQSFSATKINKKIKMIEIRKVVKNDLEGIINMLNTIQLFPPEMLDDMIADYFNNPETEEIWFTSIQDGQVCGIGYCAPEQLTD